MVPPKTTRRILIGYSSFVALCAAIILGGMLRSPSEPGSAVLFGLSLSRLALALGLLVASVLFITITIKASKNREWADKFLDEWFGTGRFSRVTGWLGGLSFGLGWIGVFLSPHLVGKFEDYLVRAQPVLVFILMAGTATLVVLYIRRAKFPLYIESGIIKLSIVLCAACLPLLGFALYSRFGMSSSEDFWYGAGVPILAQQLIGVILGGLLFLQIERKWNFRRLDLVVFIAIFAVTVFLWAREPLQKSFLFIGPIPPNQALYPFSDAAYLDAGSQFALIGQRIFAYNSYFFERPLYLGFLVYMHSLFGQDYGMLMAVQAGMFAIFPGLVYLIGRSLNLRSVGFAAALVAILRGVNSIAGSNMMDMANPKMILTDFPAAIGVALVVLAACEWLKEPDGRERSALWLGGALGFTLMLRTNGLMLLLLIPVYAIIRFAPDWKKWLTHSVLILFAVIAITLPWELRNRSLGGQMYGSIVSKFKAVLEQRYAPPPDPNSALPQSLSPFVLKSTHILLMLYQEGDDQPDPACNAAVCFVPNHFLHNIFTSVLILPTSPLMDDLYNTVWVNFSYWNPSWNGIFSPISLLFFILNIFLIVLGISVAWMRQRSLGLLPVFVFLFYNLSNAFARTSGGRYIVPMDWIITIYFLLGGFQVIIWLAKALGIEWDFEPVANVYNTEHSKVSRNELIKATLVLLVLFGFGTLIPLSETLHPARYQNIDLNLALTENEQALSASGLGGTSIEQFLQNVDAKIFVGRALYPRYYKRDQGEPIFFPTLPMPFPRLTFTLIDSDGEQGVILPGDLPTHFPHASDVIVIGCREQGYLDALAVILLDESKAVYTRSPASELKCPLSQPVCTNNSVCK
jgi:hypothetical protein